MTNVDITAPLSQFFNILVDGFKGLLDILSSVELFGTNLLTFIISIMIASVLFGILLSTVNFRVWFNVSYWDNRKIKKKHNNDSSDS